MTALVVSPHLDDAVLSVPGLLRSRASLGERVVVVTVFSHGEEGRGAGRTEGYGARRAEDAAALALLGAEPLHLGLQDAPYRRGLPRSFRDLVLTELAADDGDAAEVARVLTEGVVALTPDVVLLPLGVGEHIDHRVVHAAHVRLVGRVGFYEDRPYALVQHAVQARLARIGATVDGVSIAASRVRAEEYVSAARAAPHVRAYARADERDACLARLAEALSAPAVASGLALRRERCVFDRPALDAAVLAVRAYASQMADLFGEADVATALSVGSVAGGPYEESVYWRAGAGETLSPGLIPPNLR